MMKRRKALLLPMILALSTGVILSSCNEGETSGSPVISSNSDSGLKESTTSSSVVQEYKVTFDSDGGTAVDFQTVEKGGKATRPADPTKAGYTFVGWFLNDEEWSFIGNAVTEDITLTARWSLNTYNITYHLNGGTNAEANPTTYTVEDSFSLEDPIGQFGPSVTVIEGKCYKCNTTFEGWYLDSGFTRPISGITPGMTGNIDVYAKFSTATDSITLDAYLDNGGTIDDFLNNGGSLEDYISDGGNFQYCYNVSYHVYDHAKYLGTADNPYLVLVNADSTSVTTVTVNENCRFICTSAFSGCTSLTSITIPEGVTYIGRCAFYNCTSLTSVMIPEGVTSIGEEVFYNCTGLTSITIPDGVTYIGSSAFGGCRSLTLITIPNSVTSIGNSAFSGCSSFTSVTIPDSVTSIGWGAFSGCSLLTSITLPEGVTSIGDWAFYGCTSLTSITIPDSVTSIGDDAFRGCNKLTSITIPDGVTYIGSSAFGGCRSLTSITIPKGVMSIGWRAFSGCTSLTSVFYKGTQEEWNNISIGSDNEVLTDATRYYYSENDPSTAEGMDSSLNYWHYVDGVPTPWRD